jgi:broad specificity phosphatase PhoE
MLTIVRHGRTDANANGLLLGRTDVALDDLGRSQASALAAAVGPVDRVVSSPLRRCVDTAAALGQPVEVDERWIELDYGDLEGRPLGGVGAETWARWRADLDFTPPGGESIAALGRRVRLALADLVAAAADQTVVVVTHVSPIKASLAWALGVGDEICWRAFVSPASVTRVAVTDRGPTLHSFNDTSHLA